MNPQGVAHEEGRLRYRTGTHGCHPHTPAAQVTLTRLKQRTHLVFRNNTTRVDLLSLFAYGQQLTLWSKFWVHLVV
jgi:hypothetical protein